MERSEAIRTVSMIAADQWGLITTAQAEAAGVSRVDLARLADAELLERVARSVYQVTGATPTLHQDIKVAWLRLDPAVPAWERTIDDDRSGVVSHASACQLHDIGDIPADDVEISVPRRRTTREPGVVFHRAAIPAEDITMVDGLPVTSVDRTVCDLLKTRADAGHVGRVIADADNKGLTDTRILAERVQPFARFYGLPRTASGDELLKSLTEQAGFTLRDHQLNSAGELAAVASALDPAPILETLLDNYVDWQKLGAAAPLAYARALENLAPKQVPPSLADIVKASPSLQLTARELAERAAAAGITPPSSQERAATMLRRLRNELAHGSLGSLDNAALRQAVLLAALRTPGGIRARSPQEQLREALAALKGKEPTTTDEPPDGTGTEDV